LHLAGTHGEYVHLVRTLRIFSLGQNIITFCTLSEQREYFQLAETQLIFEPGRREILPLPKTLLFFCIFFGGLECDGHSFAYVAHFYDYCGIDGLEPRERTMTIRRDTNMANICTWPWNLDSPQQHLARRK
jgi:hypothetical protein